MLRALELIDFADVAGPLQEELACTYLLQESFHSHSYVYYVPSAYRENQRKSTSAPATKPKTTKSRPSVPVEEEMSVDAEMADAASLNDGDDDETGTSEQGRSVSSGA